MLLIAFSGEPFYI